ISPRASSPARSRWTRPRCSRRSTMRLIDGWVMRMFSFRSRNRMRPPSARLRVNRTSYSRVRSGAKSPLASNRRIRVTWARKSDSHASAAIREPASSSAMAHPSPGHRRVRGELYGQPGRRGGGRSNGPDGGAEAATGASAGDHRLRLGDELVCRLLGARTSEQHLEGEPLDERLDVAGTRGRQRWRVADLPGHLVQEGDDLLVLDGELTGDLLAHGEIARHAT